MSEEYWAAVDERRDGLEGKNIAVVTLHPEEVLWIKDTLSDCGCTVSVMSFAYGCAEAFDSLDDLKDRLKGGHYDLIMDGLGINLGIEKCGLPLTWVTHKASVDLLREVWGKMMSQKQEEWKKWIQ